jgi:hypothetical protein
VRQSHVREGRVMTAAQELFEHLRDAKPGPNYQPKETPAPKPAPFRGRIYAPMPDWPFADLPELGGSASVVSTLGFAPVYCRSCAKPREQRRVQLERGSVVDVRPCTCGGRA